MVLAQEQAVGNYMAPSTITGANRRIMTKASVANNTVPYPFCNVSKLIYAAGNNAKGKITKVSKRYCASCGREYYCYVVRWLDGSTTKPCVASCADLPGGNALMIKP